MALDNYIAGKTQATEFFRALEEKGESANELAQTLWRHLGRKIELAGLVGLSDLPGEDFTTLAVSTPVR